MTEPESTAKASSPDPLSRGPRGRVPVGHWQNAVATLIQRSDSRSVRPESRLYTFVFLIFPAWLSRGPSLRVETPRTLSIAGHMAELARNPQLGVPRRAIGLTRHPQRGCKNALDWAKTDRAALGPGGARARGFATTCRGLSPFPEATTSSNQPRVAAEPARFHDLAPSKPRAARPPHPARSCRIHCKQAIASAPPI